MDELEIERVRHKPRHVPYSFYIRGTYHPTLRSFMSFGVHVDRLKLIAMALPAFGRS